MRNWCTIFCHSRVFQLQLLSIRGFQFVFSCAKGCIFFHVSAFIIGTYGEKNSVALAKRDLHFVASILPYNLSFCEAWMFLFVPVFSKVRTSFDADFSKIDSAVPLTPKFP